MTYEACKQAYEAVLNRCNSRQRKFVENLVAGQSKAQAAREAGYGQRAGNYCNRTLKNDCVANALELGRKLAAMGAQTTAKWVRSVLREIVETADDSGSRIAALRELARIDGHYASERREVTASVELISANDLRPEELAGLAVLRHSDSLCGMH